MGFSKLKIGALDNFKVLVFDLVYSFLIPLEVSEFRKASDFTSNKPGRFQD